MVTFKKRSDFFNSEEGQDVKKTLQGMMGDSSYNTDSSYTPNSLLYPDHLIPFVDKHMNYLNAHPNLDAQMYITNVRLMRRIR